VVAFAYEGDTYVNNSGSITATSTNDPDYAAFYGGSATGVNAYRSTATPTSPTRARPPPKSTHLLQLRRRQRDRHLRRFLRGAATVVNSAT
jgi:hypothetical protein